MRCGGRRACRRPTHRRRPCRPRRPSSATRELRRALLEERRDAFTMVVGGDREIDDERFVAHAISSAAPGVEALHDAAAVGPRLLDVPPAGVLADDTPPECLRLDVPCELRDLPLAGEGVEHPAGDLGADPLPAVPAQDEELADVPGAVA